MEGEVITTDQGYKGTEETAIASSLIPWDRDDERALYFGYRASGLSVRETLQMINRSKAWLSSCRHDSNFEELESRIPEFRRELSKEYVEIEFFRNFRLVLEKDHEIISKSLRLGDYKEHTLTKYEQDYLIKMRSQYTPAQIQILEAVVKGGEDGFNFAQFIASNPDIIQLSRTDTVTMSKQRDSDAE